MLFIIALKISRLCVSAEKVLTVNVMEETNEELSNFTIGFEDDLAVCRPEKATNRNESESNEFL